MLVLKFFLLWICMGKFKTFVHALLIITSPSILLHPQSTFVQDVPPQTEDCLLSYDAIIHLLEELESGELEQRYCEDELNHLNEFLAHLAKEGKLPNEGDDLENDIALLLNVSSSPYEYSLCISKDNHLQALFTASGQVILCGGWLSKKWKQTKHFVKKHKKAILIGTAVIVAAAVVIVAVAATSTTTAVAAAGAAAASANQHHVSKHTTPELQSSVENQIASFKETLITEDYLAADFPLEESMRTLGSLFAHQSSQELRDQLANSPQLLSEIETMRWYNTTLPAGFGHHNIDQKFATDYASHYTAHQSDFNALAYQSRGEKALTYGYYEQAVHDFSKALDHNPANTTNYLDRGVAHFKLGQYENSNSDYQHYVADKRKLVSPTRAPSFTKGFARGLRDGIHDSAEGSCLFFADLVKSPYQTSKQLFESVVILKDLIQSEHWEEIAQALAPEVHDLIVNWNHLTEYKRGELAGYAFGRHGTDFLLPAAAAKAAKSCKELIVISKNLKLAEKTLLLETTSAIPNASKIIETNIQTIALAEELGFPTSTTSQLKKSGVLNQVVTETFEGLTPELQKYYELYEHAQNYLKPHSKNYISEVMARELIHQTGIKTFPRPAGIPENYRIKISNKGAGIKYVHPKKEETYVRVMPGKPHSQWPYQQKPYVVQMKDGKAFDRHGNLIDQRAPEAHIPIEEFIYRE
jgi:tetratricopeptide (TPR) repeat protein